MFNEFKINECGATLVEYGVALIVALVIGGTGLTGLAAQTKANMDATTPTLQTR